MPTPTIADEVTALAPTVCGDLDAGTVAAAIAQITVMAKAYTRDNGFTAGVPNAEIRAVIVTAAVRLLANPYQSPVDFGDRTTIQSLRGGFTGWSTAELTVLNRYRVRAQ